MLLQGPHGGLPVRGRGGVARAERHGAVQDLAWWLTVAFASPVLGRHPCSGQGQWMPVAGRCQLSHHRCLCWGWDGATAAVGNWGRNARADKAVTPPCPQTQQ